MEDRSWMYRRTNNGFLNKNFLNGVEEFLDFAFSIPENISNERIRCPCFDCKNMEYHTRVDVNIHLVSRGFVEKYLNWRFHGEVFVPHERMVVASSSSSRHSPTPVDNMNSYRRMVVDAMGMDYDYSMEEPNEMVMEEEPNIEARKFFQMLKDADEPVWDGCTTHTKLSAIARGLSIKAQYRMSEANYDNFAEFTKELLPTTNSFVDTFYEIKKLMQPLGLGYEKIDMCPNFCMLYHGDDINQLLCKVCAHPRYKPLNNGVKSKLVAYKKLWYLPLTPRLQRLFMSSKTSKNMTWHHFHSIEDGVMAHPSDGQAWRNFNLKHREFAMEPRNVRLGLCTDGFSPYGMSSSPYSCWPVIITVYNLPPGMCMRREFMFLNTIIPGPHNPRKNIDVCLRPLIDELKHLWSEGVVTYDVSKKQNFRMHAALMWTINDFPAYGMLSGWSTHGKLACPYCMHHTKSFTLKNGGKASWFDCHRRFLPMNHRYRSNRKDFIKGRTERDQPPPFPSGEYLLHEVRHLPEIVYGLKAPNKKLKGFGKTHNWIKRSIFWELPYWHTNIIRHNLDVMHIEKNVFDNIFNTIMDVKQKTKDNVKARLDLALYCDRDNMLLRNDGNRVVKPKASFVLEKNAQRLVLEWLLELKFPDGYASNISRCVNLEDNKLYGMKSHDCHVFMQRLLPIAFRQLLPTGICDALTEVSHFFRDLCSPILRVHHMQQLQQNIVESICKLERIFPPSFFDSMEHLIIHLAYEAMVCGPVQYRWMYPFERYLFELKQMVKNKARVEGSICEAYILDEISTFCSFYFEEHVRTRINRVPRNDDGGEVLSNGRLSVFCHSGRPITKREAGTRYLEGSEYDIAHRYVLLNCEELKSFIEQHYDIISENNPNTSDMEIERLHESQFSSWLRNHVFCMETSNIDLRCLAAGPATLVKFYNGYYVGGFIFHTEKYGRHKSTKNFGVCVKGSSFDEVEQDYYGIIEEIIELNYHGEHNQVVLFKCHWFDTNKGLRVDHHGLVEVKYNSRLPSDDVFVLAQQCQQVFYTRTPSLKKHKDITDWRMVVKTRARSRVEVPTTNDDDMEAVFQDDEMQNPYNVAPSIDLDDPHFRIEEGSFIEIDVQELGVEGFDINPFHFQQENETEDEELDEDSENNEDHSRFENDEEDSS